ncbi:MAG TPA: hypothetical protein VLV85_08680 [Stellaceae bacterium]|nr:hypothetical protein [Stellaceae bacterium]
MAAKRRSGSHRRGKPIKIAVINEAKEEKVPARDLAKVVAALQKQIERDFAPVWGIEARLSLVPEGEALPEDAWWLTLLDDTDRAGNLGYHDLTSAGLPLGKAFIATAEADKMPWSVVLSHELLEMLIDPYINLSAFVRDSRSGLLYGYEVCDPVRSDNYRIDGVAVSNFVYPDWFLPPELRPDARLDHMEKIGKPLQIRPGGYAIFNELGAARKKGWHAKAARGKPRSDHREGTRPHRRATTTARPKLSKAKRAGRGR